MSPPLSRLPFIAPSLASPYFSPEAATAFDLETFPVWPGLAAPPPVTLQWMSTGDLEPSLVSVADGTLEAWASWVLDQPLIVGHFIAYDLAVLCEWFPALRPKVFKALLENRVTDTNIRERLIRIALDNPDQEYGLAEVCNSRKIDHGYHVGASGKKDEYWRVRYGTIAHLRSAEMPEEARRYALADGRNTLTLWTVQQKHSMYLRDEFRQTRAAFALYLMTCRGILTDSEAVEAFIARVEAEIVEDLETLQLAGLVRADGTKDKKATQRRMVEACARAGIEPKITDAGETKRAAGETDLTNYISTDKEMCNAVNDEVLEAYARFTSANTKLTRAERLRNGVTTPIQVSYNVLVETGRTSARQGDVKVGEPVSAWGTQIQNQDRKAVDRQGNPVPGLRDCFIPRPGNAIGSVDYSAAELHSLSEVNLALFGRSEMGEMLRKRMDLHLAFGATLLGISYEEGMRRKKNKDKQIAEYRQMSKAFNFGVPGGMGAEKFQIFARQQYDVRLDIDTIKAHKKVWLKLFPEMTLYFKFVGDECENQAPVVHLYSERFRAATTPYTARSNSRFQGHTADMAKDALFEFAWRCYVGDLAGLGIYPLGFVHDEILFEAPLAVAHLAAMACVETMEAASRRWLPRLGDCPAEPALSLRWLKAAEPATRDGRLIPWELATPEEKKGGWDKVVCLDTYRQDYQQAQIRLAA